MGEVDLLGPWEGATPPPICPCILVFIELPPSIPNIYIFPGHKKVNVYINFYFWPDFSQNSFKMSI